MYDIHTMAHASMREDGPLCRRAPKKGAQRGHLTCRS
jgi:hypothetical protein